MWLSLAQWCVKAEGDVTIDDDVNCPVDRRRVHQYEAVPKQCLRVDKSN